ncbi:MAG: nitroreductase [Gammaproteobacteria bacterium]|jgi:nitroreductase
MSEIGLFEAIYSTRSMRRLKPDPIPREVMEKIIEAAVHAPSGSNFQNWAFVVVEAADDKRFIRDRYLKYYRELERLGSIPSMDAIPEERRRMFATATHLAEHMDEVPVLLLACTGTDFPTYADANNPRSVTATLHASIYPAVQNILLAARALGVGATLTTLHYFFEEELKERLEIPADKEVAGLIPMGYPHGRFGPTTRRRGQDVTHWGSWQTGPDAD